MMVYEYGGQLNGIFKPGKRRKNMDDREALKAEVEAIHARVGK